MGNFRSRLASFMRGRYGVDALYWWSFGAILVLWIVRVVLTIFGFYIAARILSSLSTVILVIAVFRFMSRNIYKRSAENRKFMQILGKVKGKYILVRDRFRDRKTHVFKKCPSCGAMIRLPRRSGEHTVKCPKCSKRFDVKIK